MKIYFVISKKFGNLEVIFTRRFFDMEFKMATVGVSKRHPHRDIKTHLEILLAIINILNFPIVSLNLDNLIIYIS